MATERLTKDLIAQPQVWRLELLLAPDAVDAVFFSPLEDHALMHRRLPLHGASPIAALEDMVYDNPLLLAPFDRVDILVDTRRFMLVPAEIADAGLTEGAMRTLWPEQSLQVTATPVTGTPWRMAMAVEQRTIAFLRRTFPEASVSHRLSPLTAWLASRSSAGSAGKAYVHLRQTGIDIFCYTQGRPALVNSYDATDTADIVYFTLAAMQTCGLDPATDEIHLCGNSGRREPVAAALREHAAYVMPVFFPSAMFKAGKEALEAPFELIVLPLCV